jgi:chromosomal replication initiator protein
MAENEVVGHIWRNLLARLSADDRITAQYMGFLSLVEPKGVLGDTLYLEVANDGTRNMIDQRLRPIMIECLVHDAELGGPTNFALVVNTALNVQPTPAADVSNDYASTYESSFGGPVTPILPQTQGSVASATQIASVNQALSNPYSTATTSFYQDSNGGNHLNPNYTFDTYVIGESNRMAHAMALAVGEAPGKSYNPLFIYGNSGLGKTHLLHAIGNYAVSLYPRIRVRYVNSEEFTNDYINALRDNTMVDFQNQYRLIDVLLIDDIQFLAGKEGTQEAFFHLFNILHTNNKQVVITSDVSPKQLDGFEDRLVSRFGGGLSTDIQVPTLETRIAILRKKVERDGHPVADEILEYIASRVTRNIRELEGSLTRLTAWSSLTKQPIDMNMVQTVLKDLVAVANDEVTTPVEIMNAVAAYFGISIDELTGQSRQQAIATARQIAMYLCREMTTLSLPKVGAVFGGKDHTTVMYARTKVEKLMRERRSFYDQVTEIINIINKKAN